MKFGAIFRTDAGARVELPHEGLIGRMASAALHIDDPRISEAHALLSCRGDALKLLALRGRLTAGGKPRSEVTLSPGLRVVLGGFFGLTVEALVIPETLPVLAPLDAPSLSLPAHGVLSIIAGAPRPVRAGYQADADAWLWSTQAGHRLRVASDERPIAVGAPFSVMDRTFALTLTPRAGLEVAPTAERGPHSTRLALSLFYDTVHISPPDGRAVTLDGLAARLISELFAIGAPVAWSVLAAELWPDPALAEAPRRQRWDQLLTRIRSRLREAGLRSDLVRANGQGLVELALSPHDTVEDRT